MIFTPKREIRALCPSIPDRKTHTMFTGIIETLGQIKRVEHEAGNRHFTIASPISEELHIDQSVAHDGVCLTVTAVEAGTHTITAIGETLQKTNLGEWKAGRLVNLERCMPAHGRFDGHIVQGHVDQTATCTEVREENGSWRFFFRFPPEHRHLVVEKGSVTINGVSLTVVDAEPEKMSVAIIPYTYEHTNFKQLSAGDTINLEFDVIGKYVARMMEARR